ncbi:MAG TPA: glycosyltransferase family 1 protein [Thermoanaerobaculia bacterium]|nr:glycosyltransferase family 1 protein [Thermoanaerobaculia bacterium]
MAYTIGLDTRNFQDHGIGTYARQLVHALAKVDQENKYMLLARTQDRDAFRDLPDNFHPVYESAPVYSIRELWALSWRLLRLRVDVYHSTHYVTPAVLRSPVVVTVYDVVHLFYPDFLPSRFAFLYAQRMIHRTLSRADRIIAVTQGTRADLMQHFDVDARKVQVVYNGVRDEFRQKLAPEELERWRRDLGLQGPYVLFVGNPNPRKNLDTVVQAYARARQLASFDAPLVCIGDRAGTELKLRQRAANLGVAGQVRLLGRVAPEAMPAIYQGASLFLYPTLYEGSAMPVIEAMASGVTVITSNTASLKEAAEGYAHLVDPLDIEGMAKAIAHCMSDPEHRAALSRLGSKRAEDFRWAQTARKTVEIYRAAIERRRATPAGTVPATEEPARLSDSRTDLRLANLPNVPDMRPAGQAPKQPDNRPGAAA